MAKNKWIAFLLCLFLGAFGAHKFYERRFLFGIVYLFTGGLAGIGIIIDLVILLFKPNPIIPKTKSGANAPLFFIYSILLKLFSEF